MSVILLSIFFNVFDLLTGFLSAFKSKQIESCKMRNGIYKKSGFILIYILCFIVDKYGVLIGFNFDFSLLNTICAIICLTEIVSILENIEKITGSNQIIVKIKDLLGLKNEENS